ACHTCVQPHRYPGVASRAPGPVVDSTAVVLALEGLLVVDLTQSVAGPFCTQILGDMGAEVVKVERPGRGDDARAWAPPYWGDESATFMSVNRNKRSLAVDMKQPDGRAVVERLIGRADVLVQSLRAGAVEELGQGSGTAMICPYEAFPTRDDWVMIAAGSDALFAKASEALGVRELPRDPRFKDNPARVAHRAELFDALSTVTRALASADVLGRLQ